MEPVHFAIGVVSFLVTTGIIEIAPIKVAPWSAAFRWIGKKIMGDVSAQLVDISDKLDSHIEEDARDKAKRLRGRILRFADELLQGERHSQEHFNEILEDITEYNRYCATHPDFPNDKAAISIGHIENVYRARLENNDFL